MNDYIFQECKFTGELTFSYEPWLFHLPSHLGIQNREWITYTLFNNKHKMIDAHLHLFIDEAMAISPFRAPFGSIQFVSFLKPNVLFKFIEFVCRQLKEKGVTNLILKNPPDVYETYSSPLLNTFLLNLGFNIEAAEVGAALPISKDFVVNLNAWEKRRLRQGEAAKLEFAELTLENLKSVYEFILDCRVERDYKLPMDWETLQKTVTAYQDRFLLFAVIHKDEIAAASLSIDVGNGVLYNFLSAHPRKYDRLSPVVLLMKGIYDFCRVNEFSLLDLGTSAVEGVPNFKLLNFKLGLGAQPTMKLTFKKEL